MNPNGLNSSIQNETSLLQTLVGRETATATFATPTARWYGDLSIARGPRLSTKPERRRSRDGMRNAKFMAPTFSGTYADELAFETFPEYLQYAIHPAPSGVSDSESTPGYTHTYEPSSVVPSTFSAEHGFEGIPRRATGLQFDEITIGADVGNTDGHWTFSGNLIVTQDVTRTPVAFTATGGSTSTFVDSGAPFTSNSEQGKFVRVTAGHDENLGQVVQVVSNTTTTLTFDRTLTQAIASSNTIEIMPLMTAGVADRDLNYIPTEGTKIYIADALADIEDAGYEIPGKLISFSVSLLNNIRSKKFLSDIGKNSPKRGYGNRVVTLTGVMEWDDWNEYRYFEANTPEERSVLLKNTNGPVIDSGAGTTHEVGIRLPSVFWNSMNPNNEREGNRIVNFDAYAYYNDTDGSTSTWFSKSTVQTVPA